MSEITKKESACCALAEKLGARIADLDVELRRPDHRSFRKLAEAIGLPGQKSVIERHKKGCLRIGQGYDVPPVKDPPPGRTVRVESVPAVSQGQSASAGTLATSVTRARAPEPSKGSKTLLERTAHIVSQMSAGTWDSARDIGRCAAAWGLHEQTVRDEVRVIYAARRLNRGDVEAREEESLAFYTWQVEDLQATLADDLTPDEKGRIHARITEVRSRMDSIVIPKVGGGRGFSPDDPEFARAVGQYVEAVNATLEDAAGIGLDVADIPPEHVERVLRAARKRLDERLAALVEPALVNAADAVR
jgi:hypothetical protein